MRYRLGERSIYPIINVAQNTATPTRARPKGRATRRRKRGRRIFGRAGLLGMAALLLGSTIAIAAGGYAGDYGFWTHGL